MTDFDMRCGRDSAREYVRSTLTGTTVKRALPMIFCASLLTAMIIVGIIGYFWTQSIIMLGVSLCAVLLGVGIVIFMKMMINSTADKLISVYEKQDNLVCSVSENDIIIVRDNRPVRVIGWDKITEMSEGKNAFFIKEGDDGLLILDKSKVLSGAASETGEIIAKKLGEAK
jgi:hypothetical protein